MRRLLPDPAAGGFGGFILGFLACFNLAYLGVEVAGWPAIGLGLLGAAGGYVVVFLLHSPSARARTVARCCVTGAVALGGVAFLVGFVGPIVLHPELPQGPLLGIFCT